MRVISGIFKGLRLKSVPGKLTRPTTDKVKESMFDILSNYNNNKGKVLDLYSGSGALGIEAISRGYSSGVLVDNQYMAIKTIKENILSIKCHGKFKVLNMSDLKALKFLSIKAIHFSLVILDPPYKKQKINEILSYLSKYNLLSQNSIIIVETDNSFIFKNIKNYFILSVKNYRNTKVSILQYRIN